MLEMTLVNVVIYVEGKSDRFFYDRIAALVCNRLGIAYQIRSGEEIDGAAGGKQVLLAFFEVLRAQNKLQGYMGKSACAFFFLDKDIDDLKGTLVQSDYLVYTSPYHYENYLFMWGDVLTAAASVSDLDRGTVEEAIGDTATWRRDAAVTWKEWVVLCALSETANVNVGAGYHSTSRIHQGGFGEIDEARLDFIRTGFAGALGITPAEYSAREKLMRELVDRIYEANNYDSVFKGKWYANLLIARLKRARHPTKHSIDNISTHICPVLLATLDFSQPWSIHLRTPLESAIGNILRA